MSFFGEATGSGLDVVARNTPMRRDGIRWPKSGGLANISTINIGRGDETAIPRSSGFTSALLSMSCRKSMSVRRFLQSRRSARKQQLDTSPGANLQSRGCMPN
ncbi:hypothetical protein [Mesorhizobium sp. M1378]|uniref:hypothetical protein n=1 Tax=Mesorhizobium sp. M1378 TaxID=2957092 RepID=UPI00333973D2